MPGKRVSEDRRREQILEAACQVALAQRLSGLSTRAVAAKAGVSNGLVFFYFRSRRELLLALLEWLLAKTILRRGGESGAAPESAYSRLSAEVQGALDRLQHDRTRIELFFDFWFMGTRDDVIRNRIREALKRHRDSYLPLAQAVVAEQPARFPGVTGESLADIAASFIEGCALRLVADPRNWDLKANSRALAAILSPACKLDTPEK